MWNGLWLLSSSIYSCIDFYEILGYGYKNTYTSLKAGNIISLYRKKITLQRHSITSYKNTLWHCRKTNWQLHEVFLPSRQNYVQLANCPPWRVMHDLMQWTKSLVSMVKFNLTKLGVLYTERIMNVLEWRTVSALTRGLFWCLFPELRSYNYKHQNNTRVSAETVRHESTYIMLFLTRHNEPLNDDKKWPSLHIVPVSHSLGFRSVYDVTRTHDKWYLTR